MNRDEAIQLLRSASKGVAKWNRHRQSGLPIPDLSRADLSRLFLCGVDFQGVCLRDSDLSSADLTNADLSSGDLKGANLYNSDLSHAILHLAHLDDADLRSATFLGADLCAAELIASDLRGVDLRRNNLIGANLRRANLASAHLDHACFREANLGGANLESAELRGADLRDADLRQANLKNAELEEADLRNADLRFAQLSNVNLGCADLRGARLVPGNNEERMLNGLEWDKLFADESMEALNMHKANLHSVCLNGAVLCNADFTSADLRDADLRSTDFTEADFSDADLSRANLTESNLTRSRFIRTNMCDAIVENALVRDIQLQDLRGLPQQPVVLRIQDYGARISSGGEVKAVYEGENAKIVLSGERARSFFVQLKTVEIVLNRPLSDAALGLYDVFIGDCRTRGEWPPNIVYRGGYVESGQTILSYDAPDTTDILQNTAFILSPFRLSEAVDWRRLFDSCSPEQVEAVTSAALAKPLMRSALIERLWMYDGFSNATPTVMRTSTQEFRLLVDPNVVAKLPPGATFAPQLIGVVENMTTQHFEGGRFEGCSFGDKNSQTNYFGAVDASKIPEEDIKTKLKEARIAIEESDLPNEDKADAVDQLKKLTLALDPERRDRTRIRRFWGRLKEIAPPIAAILASAASLARLIQGN